MPGPDATPRDPRLRFGVEDSPWTERDECGSHPRYLEADATRRRLIEEFHRDGVVILRGAVRKTLCREAIESLRPRFADVATERVTNAWWKHRAVAAIAATPAVIDVIELLYDRAPIPFQTLNFGRGTEQAGHRDELHFDSLPPSFLCGAWVALEDVGPDQGPILYRPGSQRDPRPGIRHWDSADGEPSSDGEADRLDDDRTRTFLAEAGDVIIWAAGVVHGGAPVTDGTSSRWSQVTHYFFEGTAWYTPLHSDVEEGSLQLRDPLIDLRTRRVRRPTMNGAPARFVHGAGRRSRLLDPGDPSPSVLARLAASRHRITRHLAHRLGPRLRR